MFLLLLLVLIFIFCFILLLKLLLPFSPHQRKRLPPGPPGVPIIGSIPFLPRTFRIKGRGLHTPKLFYYLAQKYGAVCHLWLGPVPTIVVSDTQILKKAFKNANMSSRPIMKPFHQFRYGTQDGRQRGLILSSGPEWVEQRKSTMRHLRSLGFAQRSSMESMILQEIEQMCKALTTNQSIDLTRKTNLAVVNCLWLIIAGQRYDLNDQRLLTLIQNLENLLKSSKVISLWALLFPTLYARFHPRFQEAKSTFDDFKQMMRLAIDQHRENREGADTANDFIDIYLNEMENEKKHPSFHGEKGLQSLEIVLVDLFVAGSDTTSLTINWTILYLLHHPPVQAKLHDELDRVVGRSRDCVPNLSHKGQLHYFNAVIHESMRKSNVVPSGVPHYVEEDTYVDHYFFPKGTNVMANLSYIHLNPELWKSPESFQPERFLDEFGHFCANDNLIPFSVGKRLCLGQTMAEQELFLFLTGFLFRFTFEKCPNAPLPNIDFATDEVNTSFIRYPPYYQVILKPRLLK